MTPFPQQPTLQLLHEGAAFLTDSATLIVADIHLGKSATFRARGLPVPEGDTARDLARLLQLSKKHNAAHLVIAGDFFHAPAGITDALITALSDFIAELSIPITLVVGNHDLKLREIPAGLDHTKALELGSTVCVVHDPEDATGDQLHICGHIHPVVKIADGKRTSLRLPCFLYRNHTLVLPAFGSFTGGAIIHSKAEDRIFVTLRDQVLELPATLR